MHHSQLLRSLITPVRKLPVVKPQFIKDRKQFRTVPRHSLAMQSVKIKFEFKPEVVLLIDAKINKEWNDRPRDTSFGTSAFHNSKLGGACIINSLQAVSLTVTKQLRDKMTPFQQNNHSQWHDWTTLAYLLFQVTSYLLWWAMFASLWTRVQREQ